MTYWILRLHRGVWKRDGEWWLCRFAVDSRAVFCCLSLCFRMYLLQGWWCNRERPREREFSWHRNRTSLFFPLPQKFGGDSKIVAGAWKTAVGFSIINSIHCGSFTTAKDWTPSHPQPSFLGVVELFCCCFLRRTRSPWKDVNATMIHEENEKAIWGKKHGSIKNWKGPYQRTDP